MKANFIGKYQYYKFDTMVTYLEYEYRGMRYDVMESSKGNEPLEWQHKAEQDRIDRIIDKPVKPSAEHSQKGLDLFFESLN